MTEPILHSSANRDWLLYASLELSIPAGAVLISGEQLESLLMNTLHPLGLPACFSERVLAAVRDSVERIPEEMKQVRLLVYTPDPHPEPGKTWGFFRTMKNNVPSTSSSGRHEIAVYLYVEGSPT